jgi:hypothetical protein
VRSLAGKLKPTAVTAACARPSAATALRTSVGCPARWSSPTRQITSRSGPRAPVPRHDHWSGC